MEFRPILSSLLRNKTGAVLIAAQVALSLAIVANALYVIRDRLAVAARPTGVADEATLLNISVRPLHGVEDTVAMQRHDEAVLRAIPGVRAVAWTNQVPLDNSGWSMSVATDRKQVHESANSAFFFSPGPLRQTFGLKLVQGRDFSADDVVEVDPNQSQDLGRSLIISQALAEKAYPGAASVVGKPLLIGLGQEAREMRIVGVVERLQSPWAPASERAEYSVISAMRYAQGYSLYAIRSEPGQADRVLRDAEAALLKAYPGRTVTGKASMLDNRHERYRDERAVAWLLVTVTALLLLVTGSGIVGMASLWVNQRRKQIGVRRALGARRGDILRYFITENLLISSSGIAIGLLLALALNQLLVSELELARLPLGYLAAGSLVLWLLGVLAVYGPAARAAATPPAIATRTA